MGSRAGTHPAVIELPISLRNSHIIIIIIIILISKNVKQVNTNKQKQAQPGRNWTYGCPVTTTLGFTPGSEQKHAIYTVTKTHSNPTKLQFVPQKHLELLGLRPRNHWWLVNYTPLVAWGSLGRSKWSNPSIFSTKSCLVGACDKTLRHLNYLK